MNDPSPTEIDRACKLIQATWNEADRLQREGLVDVRRVFVPRVTSTEPLREEIRWLEGESELD